MDTTNIVYVWLESFVFFQKKINQYDSGTLLILITRLKENNTYAINLLTFIDMLKAWVSPYFSEVTFYHYITFELQNSI